MVSSVYSRTLQKAAQLVGGTKSLARLLRVPIAELEKWMAGKETPPIASFLKAVDVVLDRTEPASGSEPADPPAPHDCASTSGTSASM